MDVSDVYAFVANPDRVFEIRRRDEIIMISQEVLDSVLQLPEAERLMIVGRLLESLPDQIGTGDLDEEEFLAELQRRSDDWQGAVSWTELKVTLQSGT